MDRRRMLQHSALLGAGTLAQPAHLFAQSAPALITRDAQRPQMPYGVQSGDPLAQAAVVWTRSDRPARLWLEWSSTASFAQTTRVRGPHLLEDSDFTGRIDLRDLPAGQAIFYRVVLQDLHNERVLSEPVSGHLRLPQSQGQRLRDVRFVWSGDTAGQGWGINEAWGGMKIYEQIRQLRPDFFLHCGDTIYADGPIRAILAERLRLAIELLRPMAGGQPLPITASIGVAVQRFDQESMHAIQQHADQAMYEAKRGGRNRVSTFGSDDAGWALSAM
mgnify:CR=1 FL=1